MFASPADARSPLRRQVFYWRRGERRLLPLDLSCAHRKRKERPLFSQRGRCGRSRFSPLLALPSGEFAGNAGVVGNFKYSFASVASDQRERTGGRRGGWAGRAI